MKAIVVHMSPDDDRHRRLAVAVRLATIHHAHLTGLYTRSPYVTPPAIIGRGASAVFLREMEESAREQEQALKAEFNAAIAKAGLESHSEWTRHDGEVMDGLTFHSHSADLLVVSQAPEDGVGEIMNGSRPDQAALFTSCPVLVVPRGAGPSETGQRVMIAWKRTRQAARAVRDALPILRAAASVTVVSVGTAESRGGAGERIVAYLGRHGIKAERRPDYGDEDQLASILLAHAADVSADLMVMGAYSRSRLREMLLGGPTENVLSHTTIPLMMSH